MDTSIDLRSLQGTDEWRAQRCGLLTPSRFGDLCTKGRGKDQEFGKTAWSYMYEVVSERLNGKPFVREYTPESMQWGLDHEEEAIAYYCAMTQNPVERVGFIEYIDGVCGGSPDGLVGSEGLIEVKCPHNPMTHCKTIVSGVVENTSYALQIQGYLMITGRQWCDFASYDPRAKHAKLRCYVIRVQRDQTVIDLLENRIKKANDLIENIYNKILAAVA